MGVHGLTRTVDSRPKAFCASPSKGPEPIPRGSLLIVDHYSMLYELLTTQSANSSSGLASGESKGLVFDRHKLSRELLMEACLGGDPNRYDVVLTHFVRALKFSGIELVCVVDAPTGTGGSEAARSAVWKTRFESRLAASFLLEQAAVTGGDLDDSTITGGRHLPGLAAAQSISTLQRLGVEVVQCTDEEADQRCLVLLHTRPKAYAVLSGDSDFYVLKGSRFIPWDYFNWEDGKITGTLFTPESVARGLNLLPAQLPDFAALCGTDLTSHHLRETGLMSDLGLVCGRESRLPVDAKAVARFVRVIAPGGLLSNQIVQETVKKHPSLGVAIQDNTQFFSGSGFSLAKMRIGIEDESRELMVRSLLKDIRDLKVSPTVLVWLEDQAFWGTTSAEGISFSSGDDANVTCDQLHALNRALVFGMLGVDHYAQHIAHGDRLEVKDVRLRLEPIKSGPGYGVAVTVVGEDWVHAGAGHWTPQLHEVPTLSRSQRLRGLHAHSCVHLPGLDYETDPLFNVLDKRLWFSCLVLRHVISLRQLTFSEFSALLWMTLFALDGNINSLPNFIFTGKNPRLSPRAIRAQAILASTWKQLRLVATLLQLGDIIHEPKRYFNPRLLLILHKWRGIVPHDALGPDTERLRTLHALCYYTITTSLQSVNLAYGAYGWFRAEYMDTIFPGSARQNLYGSDEDDPEIGDVSLDPELVLEAVASAHVLPEDRDSPTQPITDDELYYNRDAAPPPLLIGGRRTSKDVHVPTRLPIHDHEDLIMSEIEGYRVTCIQGETGCGKSSVVPQLIYRYAKARGQPVRIIVSQPRRIAAIQLARRVAQELGEKDVGGVVGYRISMEKTTGKDTEITFATTGYLLEWFAHNPHQVDQCTHLVLDEIHERSVDMDLLCLLVKKRMMEMGGSENNNGGGGGGFKLVLMSATLEVDLYKDYFCDVEENVVGEGERRDICVGARRFPITTVYLDQLSQGSVEGEAASLLGRATKAQWKIVAREAGKLAGQFEKAVRDEKLKAEALPGQYRLALLLALACAQPGDCVLVFLPGEAEITCMMEHLEEVSPGATDICLLVLHSMSPREEHEAAFAPAPPGQWKLVLATNIAESSITIPDVKMVIDLGLHRSLEYDSVRGMQRLALQWCSLASAKQRAGRAGRVAPGVVFRLYTQSFAEYGMPAYDVAEILCTPLERTVLRSKLLMPTEHTADLLSQAISPPSTESLAATLHKLFELGAVSSPNEEESRVTFFGKMAGRFPVDLPLVKVIILAVREGMACEGAVLAAACAAQDVFLLPSEHFLRDRFEYVSKQMESYTARCHFDQGRYSEPFMYMEVFRQWIHVSSASTNQQNDTGSKLRLLKWEQSHAIHSKRMRQFAHLVSHLCDRISEVLRTYPAPLGGPQIAQPAIRDLSILSALALGKGKQPPAPKDILLKGGGEGMRFVMAAACAPLFIVGRAKAGAVLKDVGGDANIARRSILITPGKVASPDAGDVLESLAVAQRTFQFAGHVEEMMKLGKKYLLVFSEENPDPSAGETSSGSRLTTPSGGKTESGKKKNRNCMSGGGGGGGEKERKEENACVVLRDAPMAVKRVLQFARVGKLIVAHRPFRLDFPALGTDPLQTTKGPVSLTAVFGGTPGKGGKMEQGGMGVVGGEGDGELTSCTLGAVAVERCIKWAMVFGRAGGACMKDNRNIICEWRQPVAWACHHRSDVFDWPIAGSVKEGGGVGAAEVEGEDVFGVASSTMALGATGSTVCLRGVTLLPTTLLHTRLLPLLLTDVDSTTAETLLMVDESDRVLAYVSSCIDGPVSLAPRYLTPGDIERINKVRSAIRVLLTGVSETWVTGPASPLSAPINIEREESANCENVFGMGGSSGSSAAGQGGQGGRKRKSTTPHQLYEELIHAVLSRPPLDPEREDGGETTWRRVYRKGFDPKGDVGGTGKKKRNKAARSRERKKAEGKGTGGMGGVEGVGGVGGEDSGYVVLADLAWPPRPVKKTANDGWESDEEDNDSEATGVILPQIARSRPDTPKKGKEAKEAGEFEFPEEEDVPIAPAMGKRERKSERKRKEKTRGREGGRDGGLGDGCGEGTSRTATPTSKPFRHARQETQQEATNATNRATTAVHSSAKRNSRYSLGGGSGAG